MEIGLVLSLVVFLAVLYFVFHFVKSLIKTAVMALVVVVVVIAGAGFLVMSDVRDLKENFSNSSKILLLAGEEEIAFGLKVTSLDMDGMSTIERDTLDSWEETYRKGKYKPILGDDYKLFILKNEAFDDPVGSVDEFATASENFFKEGNVVSFLMQYKEGNLIIYPETPVFKIVKLIPEKWARKVLGVLN